ncbi:MAG: DUF5106 domain-containing protein [Bacteroidales bacterium]|nr:DUF5106 domain-containing protein [Bacteroidales bacterium]
MKKTVPILLSVAVLLCCAPKKKQAPAPVQKRAFPQVEMPSMLEGDALSRMEYAAVHYWDAFTKGDYPTDSLLIGGVEKEEVERQMGIFATLAGRLPNPEKAMSAMVDRISAKPELFDPMTDLAERYFYDPNSPLRSEECYLYLASRLAASPLVDETARGRYSFQAGMCSLNRPGTAAADFSFTDLSGRRRTLYSIKAKRLLLIFGNPDCTACKELVRQMDMSAEISAKVASGQLKVVDIFIDREVDAWKAGAADYPKKWINGYDHNFTIRENRLYNVRAIPSMYLLDTDKRVLLKDAPIESVLEMLASEAD